MIIIFAIFIFGLINYLFVPMILLKIKNEKLKKIIYYASNVLLIIFLSLAYGLRNVAVGTDTYSYYRFFIKDSSYVSSFEFLYTLLNRICYYICKDFNVFLVVVGLIIFTNTIISINCISKNKLCSYFCFVGLGFYFQSFNIIRQWIAISFILVGLIFLLKNKYFYYVFFTLIAVGFHKTALVALVFICFKCIKFNCKLLLILLICAGFFVGLFPFIVKLIDCVLKTSYYGWYIEINNTFDIKSLFITMGLIVVFVSMLVLRKYLNKDDKKLVSKYDFFVYSVFCAVPIQVVALLYTEYAERLSYYFIPLIIFVIPLMINIFNEKWKRILSCILYPSLIVFVCVILNFGVYGFLPYTPCF